MEHRCTPDFGDDPVPVARKRKGKYDELIEIWPVGKHKRVATKSECISLARALRIRGFGFVTQQTNQGINVWKTDKPENHRPLRSTRCTGGEANSSPSGLPQE